MFTGERVRLRGLQESDLGDLARMEADADTLRLRRAGPVWPGGVAEAEALYERAKTDAPGRFHFAVESVGDGRFLGRASLKDVRWTHRSAEVGVGLLAEETGAGHGAEALRLLVAYAFQGLALHRVFAAVRADDQPAVALFTAAGFLQESRYREEAIGADGQRLDVLSLSMLEDEWREEHG